jgi:hypothetical protein
LRPREQLDHLRVIRDELLSRSPQGQGYALLFDQFGRELLGLLLRDAELLKMVDGAVAGVLTDIPRSDSANGKLSRETAGAIKKVMDRSAEMGSPELRLAIEYLKPEIEPFVGKPAGEVLARSWELGRPRVD